MKKLVTLVLALAAVAALAAGATAANLFMEPFNYANGNLVGNGAWVNHAAGTSNLVGIQVLNGRATGSGSNQPDDSRPFPAQGATAPVYACFEVSIPAPAGGATPKTVYFAHFKDNTTTNFPARVYVTPGSTAATFKFAITANSTSSTIGPVQWPTDLNYDTRYYLVIKYAPSAASGTATLWVNPSSEASTSISHTNANAANFNVTAFALRQSSSASTVPAGFPNGTSNWDYSVDNLGVGTTFGDACAQVTPAEHSTWGRIKTMYR